LFACTAAIFRLNDEERLTQNEDGISLGKKIAENQNQLQ
jgi:hypothetical protein